MPDSQGTENVEICLIAGYFYCLDLSLQKIEATCEYFNNGANSWKPLGNHVLLNDVTFCFSGFSTFVKSEQIV